MKLEEMKDIWCAQDEAPWYAFDEEALHRNITSKKERATRRNNIYDFGMTAVLIIVAILYIFTAATIYDYLIMATFLLNAGYVWMGRVSRKKKEQTFGRTMLGDLDYAIHSVNFEMDRKKIMRWTFVLPVVILALLSMWQDGASFWEWVAIGVVFGLSPLIARWEYTRCRKPKKQKLEALREKLTEKTEAELL